MARVDAQVQLVWKRDTDRRKGTKTPFNTPEHYANLEAKRARKLKRKAERRGGGGRLNAAPVLAPLAPTDSVTRRQQRLYTRSLVPPLVPPLHSFRRHARPAATLVLGNVVLEGSVGNLASEDHEVWRHRASLASPNEIGATEYAERPSWRHQAAQTDLEPG
jgi:hypothetical protein